MCGAVVVHGLGLRISLFGPDSPSHLFKSARSAVLPKVYGKMSLYSSHTRSALIGASVFSLVVLFLLYNYDNDASSPLHFSEHPSDVTDSDLLNHVFNRTLGVSEIPLIHDVTVDILRVPEDTRYQSAIAHRLSGLHGISCCLVRFGGRVHRWRY